MRTSLIVASVLVLSIIGEAWAGCPPGTRYQCTQGWNGKVVCSCV